jgi:exosome complex component RRP42
MTITPTIKKDYLIKLAEKGIRNDGRKFNDFRDIEIETGIVSKAEGSAKVKIGNTQVMAGIKMDMGEPYPDSQGEGVMTTAAELIPLASPDFEAGPPRENAIELARVVDRGIRESKIIDVEKLCIEEGEKVWIVFIDLHILDYDGNLFDAASLAALSALMTAKIPVERVRPILEKIQDKYPGIPNILYCS